LRLRYDRGRTLRKRECTFVQEDDGHVAPPGRRIRHEEFLVELARAYYERDLTQEQVAEEFGISRSQVSRYLKEARERDIVQIKVVGPDARDRSLETALRSTFPSLRGAVVASVFSANPSTVRRAIARAGARLLARLVRPGMTISIGAGRTRAARVDVLDYRPLQGVTVAQAMGNAGHEGLEIDYHAIAQRAALAFGGRAVQINAPAILGPGTRADELEASNPQIRDALRISRSAQLFLLGIGSMTGDQIYVRTGLIRPEELDQLAEAGAVGDLCGNFFDLGGRPVPGPFDDRVVGIHLDDLARAPLVVGCGGGEEKVTAILGALRGRFVTALVTDEHTARGVLDAATSSGSHVGGVGRRAVQVLEEVAR
jgi:dihydroxyacetone kinase-like protein